MVGSELEIATFTYQGLLYSSIQTPIKMQLEGRDIEWILCSKSRALTVKPTEKGSDLGGKPGLGHKAVPFEQRISLNKMVHRELGVESLRSERC